MAIGAIQASQIWALLTRHAQEDIANLRLQELCRDNDRVSSLVSVHNGAPDRMLLVDLSRQRMTLDTLNHLLRLAVARGIKQYIRRLAWGQNDPDNPILPTADHPNAATSSSHRQSSYYQHYYYCFHRCCGHCRRPPEKRRDRCHDTNLAVAVVPFRHGRDG